jgi:hypothetical protein
MEPVNKELRRDISNFQIVHPYNPDISIREIFNNFQLQYKEKDYFLNKEIIDGKNIGTRVFLPRITLIPTEVFNIEEKKS